MLLPSDWHQVRLGEVTIETSKWNPKREPRHSIQYVDISAVSREDLRIVGETEYPGNKAPDSARKIVHSQDTILATVRPTLCRIAKIPEHLDGEVVSTAFCVLRCDPKLVEPDFLFFATQLDSFTEGLAALETGVVYPSVRDSDVLQQQILLPPISEQGNIASVLNIFRLAIQQQSKSILITSTLKRAVMQKLFTRGLRDEPQKQTEIGPIPESWAIMSVAKAVKPLRSGTGVKVPKSDYNETGRWPIIDQGQEFIAGYIDDESRVIHHETPVIIFGDHTRIFKFVDFSFTLGADGTKPLLATDGFIPKYLYYALCNLRIQSRGYNRHYTVLKEMLVGKPSVGEQHEMVAILDTIDRKIELSRKKRAVLDDLFKALLHQLMTGKIRTADLNI